MDKKAIIAVVSLAVVAVVFLVAWKKKDAWAGFPVGDLDNDEKLTLNDIEIVQMFILGFPISQISPLTEAEFLSRADVNKNGQIDMGDVTAIERLMVGQALNVA